MEDLDSDLIELDQLLNREDEKIFGTQPEREPCPLELYIRLYRKNPNELYISYFKGLRYLIHWLGPTLEAASGSQVPRLLNNYEIQELAKHLKCSQWRVFNEILKQEGVIE